MSRLIYMHSHVELEHIQVSKFDKTNDVRVAHNVILIKKITDYEFIWTCLYFPYQSDY